MSSKKRKFIEIETVNKDKENHRFCGTKNCKCSFASHPKSKYWNYEKNGNITPGDLKKTDTSKEYWFYCDKCLHTFSRTIKGIVYEKKWCKQCKI